VLCAISDTRYRGLRAVLGSAWRLGLGRQRRASGGGGGGWWVVRAVALLVIEAVRALAGA
jgi:hypothetical protein